MQISQSAQMGEKSAKFALSVNSFGVSSSRVTLLYRHGVGVQNLQILLVRRSAGTIACLGGNPPRGRYELPPHRFDALTNFVHKWGDFRRRTLQGSFIPNDKCIGDCPHHGSGWHCAAVHGVYKILRQPSLRLLQGQTVYHQAPPDRIPPGSAWSSKAEMINVRSLPLSMASTTRLRLVEQGRPHHFVPSWHRGYIQGGST